MATEQRTVVVVRRRSKAELRYLPSQRYAVDAFIDWGNGNYSAWFSLSHKTRRSATIQGQSALHAEKKAGRVVTYHGFEEFAPFANEGA